MALSPGEYMTRLGDLGVALSTLRDDLYAATEEAELAADERDTVLAEARRRLDEYDALMSDLEGNQKAEASQTLDDDINAVREYVAQLEGGGGT